MLPTVPQQSDLRSGPLQFPPGLRSARQGSHQLAVEHRHLALPQIFGFQICVPPAEATTAHLLFAQSPLPPASGHQVQDQVPHRGVHRGHQVERGNIMKTIKYIFVFFTVFLVYNSLHTQDIEDALRFSQPNAYITPRAGGLNVSFHGISDDFAALAFTPAGLSLVNKTELTFGLGVLRNSTETDFLKNSTSFNSNDAYISNAGIVVPFDTKHGNAAVGIGYILESNYDNNYKFEGFNPNSSIIQYYSNMRHEYMDDNLAYHQWLADFLV